MADHRHKRVTPRPRTGLAAGSLAVLATAGAVTIGVLGAGGTPSGALASGSVSSASASPSATPSAPLDERVPTVSRGSARSAAPRTSPRAARAARPAPPTAAELAVRPEAVARAIADADTSRWTTTVLNLWTAPGADATQDGDIDTATKVLVTGRTLEGREEIVTGAQETRWVTAGYLADAKPEPEVSTDGLSDAPCPDTSVEYRLTAYAVHVYRSVCHAFPQITTYGGYDAHGEHASGKALDIMTSDPALLTAIGDYLREHAAELHLYDVIRLQHIWTPERASEGWRYMSDRGSATANHYDHVHVSTY